MESSLSAETWGEKNMASNKVRALQPLFHFPVSPSFSLSVFSSLLTSENLPSPNHCSHLMPWLACLLPVARHVTTMPGHQENPLIFPHTSSPMPKPLLSWVEEAERVRIRSQSCTLLYFTNAKNILIASEVQKDIKKRFDLTC